MNSTLIKSMIPEEVLQNFVRKQELPDFNGDIVVEAIDIGYGYTKYTKGVSADGKIVCDLFPSIAAISPQEEMGGEFFVQRNTIKVDVGGITWEVGPDVNDIKGNNDVRALHENFVRSEQWKVLLMGALAYIGKQEIDYLVLGLPVSNMSQKDEVMKNAAGVHKIAGKEITVKNVLVIPQPLGALYNHAIKSGDFARFSQTNTLVIDPGYLTFDFLVTKGFSVNSHRSGARPGGMSSILNAIASSIAQEQNVEFDDLEQIDNALNLKNYGAQNAEKRVVYAYGKPIALNPHIKNTIPVIEGSMNFMLTKIGTSKDIAQLIMAGGPNKIFDKAIAKQFPHHEVKTLDDGIFSNVIGFMLWAMMTAYGLMITADELVSTKNAK